VAEQRDRKPAFRAAFREYVREELGEDLGRLSDKQRSWALVRYYMGNIHNRLRTFVSEDELEEGHVDGANDLEVDLIHRDNGNVLIVQAKHRQEGSSEQGKDIEHFQSVLGRLTDTSFKKNSKLHDALAEIDFDNDSFELRYITLGRVEGQAKEQASKGATLPTHLKKIEDRVQFEVLDEAGLTDELRNALSMEAGIPGKWELFTHGPRGRRSSVVEIDAGGHRSVVLVVAASQIVEMYKKFRDSLFTVNIRNYIGNTATNKGIIDTARKDPAHFFHFNNGVSCLAKALTVSESGDRIEVEGLQVINGAQTVKALFKARDAWKPGDETALVLMRVTAVPKGYGVGREFGNDVIRFNNTQNVIRVSDFRSNDPIQNDLRAKFDNLTRRGKRADYIPKRTDKIRSNAIPIRMEDFAKTVYSFLRDPIAFSGNSSFLFDDSEGGGYRYVFGDGKQVWATMPESDFKLRAAIWWMAEVFGERRKRDRTSAKDPAELGALERKWMLLYVLKLILERSFGGESYKGHLSRFYRGEWNLGEGPDGKWFAELYEKAKGAIVYVYGEAMKRDGFIHRNWMRSPETLRDLSDFVKRAPGMTVEARR
jgi:hypothetical protein